MENMAAVHGSDAQSDDSALSDFRSPWLARPTFESDDPFDQKSFVDIINEVGS
jgi:hypothetical protein